MSCHQLGRRIMSTENIPAHPGSIARAGSPNGKNSGVPCRSPLTAPMDSVDENQPNTASSLRTFVRSCSRSLRKWSRRSHRQHLSDHVDAQLRKFWAGLHAKPLPGLSLGKRTGIPQVRFRRRDPSRVQRYRSLCCSWPESGEQLHAGGRVRRRSRAAQTW